MAPLSDRGPGHSLRNFKGNGNTRPANILKRPVCTPKALAPRSPRKRLVTRNFKQPGSSPEESAVVKPRTLRHPITEDPASGGSPSETATQKVLFHAGPDGTVTAAPLQGPPSLLRRAVGMASFTVQLARRPRMLLRAVARGAAGTAGFWVPVAILLLAQQLGLQPVQLLMQFWAFYNAALDSYPFPTKLCTGLVGCILGDYVAQVLAHDQEVQAARKRQEAAPAFAYDAERAARLVVYNLIVGTPVAAGWFALLDARITSEGTGVPDLLVPLAKMAVDQLLMSPLSTAVFFTVMRCWEGHRQDALQYTRRKLWPTLKVNYCIWPFAHLINFFFVPSEMRILYINVVGVAWTVILTTIHNERAPPSEGMAAMGAAGGVPGPVPGGGMPKRTGTPGGFGVPSH